MKPGYLSFGITLMEFLLISFNDNGNYGSFAPAISGVMNGHLSFRELEFC